MRTKTAHLTTQLADQLDFHWQHQLRPRLEGLTDDAVTALKELDGAYAAWLEGITGLDDADLEKPVGPAEAQWADQPMTTLILHINREVIHHEAEIALLRDLYAHRTGTKEN
jgi:hypothetical protein